jgi:hypothetical protein
MLFLTHRSLGVRQTLSESYDPEQQCKLKRQSQRLSPAVAGSDRIGEKYFFYVPIDFLLIKEVWHLN